MSRFPGSLQGNLAIPLDATDLLTQGSVLLLVDGHSIGPLPLLKDLLSDAIDFQGKQPVLIFKPLHLACEVRRSSPPAGRCPWLSGPVCP